MLLRRSPTTSIDVFAAAPALGAFAERQGAVLDTAHALKLTENHAVLIGGAGLAAQDLDTYVGNGSDFDLDAFVDDPTFKELQNIDGVESRPVMEPTEVHVPATETRLPTSGLGTPLSDGFAETYRARTFDDLRRRAIAVNGLSALAAPELARAKLYGRGDPKDLAGIIKAHAVGWITEHPLSQDPVWQSHVLGACYIAERKMYHRDRSVRRSLPRWLGQLTTSGFDHPAFRSLDSNALARSTS